MAIRTAPLMVTAIIEVARKLKVPVRMGVLLGVSVLLLSCQNSDGGSGEVPLREGGQLLVHAQQVIRSGEAVPLREIAEGDWDRVYAFPGESSKEFVESTVGGRVDMPEIYNNSRGGIVVFVKGSEVLRAVELRPYPFDGNRRSYGRNVIAKRPHTEAAWLRLMESS